MLATATAAALTAACIFERTTYEGAGRIDQGGSIIVNAPPIDDPDADGVDSSIDAPPVLPDAQFDAGSRDG